MILNHMNKNGAVLFKNFDMSKDPEGFRRVWEVCVCVCVWTPQAHRV